MIDANQFIHINPEVTLYIWATQSAQSKHFTLLDYFLVQLFFIKNKLKKFLPKNCLLLYVLFLFSLKKYLLIS